MLARLKGAGLLWPTAFALAALAVLVGLGTWQLQRRQWKEALIAKIAARVKAEPISARARAPQARGGRRRRVHSRGGTRPLPSRQGALSLRARQVGPRLARLYAARIRAPAHRLGQPRLRPRRVEEPAIAARRGRAGWPGGYRRHRAAAAAAGPLHAAEQFRPQSLVLAGRCRHDGVRVRRRSRSKQRPSRSTPMPRRIPARGRAAAPRASTSPTATWNTR